MSFTSDTGLSGPDISDVAPSDTGSATPLANMDEQAGTDDTYKRVSRFNAWFFDAFDRYNNVVTETAKREVFAGLGAVDIVEIGAGVGANFDYIPAGARLIAIEPNGAMHGRLHKRAAERQLDLEIHSAFADRMPLADNSVDEVLCSLVLCTVDDPAAVLAEVVRVLRPGGRFRFVEHVEAPASSPRRAIQRALRRPWRWLFEGCDLCRNTAAVIESAGFSYTDITHARLRRSIYIPVNTTIHGVAVR